MATEERVFAERDISEGKPAPKPTPEATWGVFHMARLWRDAPALSMQAGGARTARGPHFPVGTKRGTLNSHLSSLPGNSRAQNSRLGWQSGTFCQLRLHTAL